MSDETVTIRVRKSTHKRLKVRAARSGEDMIDLIDSLSKLSLVNVLSSDD